MCNGNKIYITLNYLQVKYDAWDLLQGSSGGGRWGEVLMKQDGHSHVNC